VAIASAAQERPLEVYRDEIGADAGRVIGGLVDLGTVAQGGHRVSAMRFHNPNDTAVRLTSCVSSCECVTIEPLPIEIAAGALVPVRTNVDLQREPSFAGELEVSIKICGNKCEPINLKVRFKVEPD
jgi:hypothetical protein